MLGILADAMRRATFTDAADRYRHRWDAPHHWDAPRTWTDQTWHPRYHLSHREKARHD